jgi:putative oxidoreductase
MGAGQSERNEGGAHAQCNINLPRGCRAQSHMGEQLRAIRSDNEVNTKNYLRWIPLISLAVAGVVIAWGVTVLLTQPVKRWFATSTTLWMAFLLVSVLSNLRRRSFTALSAAALGTAVVGRLFSTLRLGAAATPAGTSVSELDLFVATGPGIPGFAYLALLLGALLFAQFVLSAIEDVQSSAGEQELRLRTWALTFVRIYVGLMFVPHVGGHLLAGPAQFAIYTQYFAVLGMPFPSVGLGLAGAIEFVSALGLVLGLCTRPVAFLAATYLLVSMWLGGHFTIGYVWALPDGGYEFGVFWAIIIAVFTVVGGGPLSVDGIVRQSNFHNRWPRLRAARFLFL